MGRRTTQSIRIRPLDRHGPLLANPPRTFSTRECHGVKGVIIPEGSAASSGHTYEKHHPDISPPQQIIQSPGSLIHHTRQRPRPDPTDTQSIAFYTRSPTRRSPNRRPDPLPSKFSRSPSPFPTPPFRPFFPTTVSYRHTRLRRPQEPPPLPLPPATTSGSVCSTASVHAHSRLPRISKITAWPFSPV